MGNWHWFKQGVRGILHLPVLMLTLSLVGFAALAHDADISLSQTIFIQVTVWALPSMLVLVDGMTSNTPITVVILGVALAAVRFMPMIMAILPEMRNPKTPTWVLMVICHFMAITAWVFAFARFDKVPRENRLAFFFGFSLTLCIFSTIIMALAYQVSTNFPPVFLVGLAFIIPVYFSTMLWKSARINADRLALIFGVILAPIFYYFAPSIDLVLVGLIGGTAAFFLRHKVKRL